MKDMLEQSRALLGEVPRKFSLFKRIHNRLPRAKWLIDSGTGLEKIYTDQRLLLEKGKVVWGCVIEANEMLWHGESDANAAVIFSPDPYFDDHLEELASLAETLGELKEQENPLVDDDVVPFLNALKSEKTIMLNKPLPESLTGGRKVYLTITTIFLKHLPFPALRQGWLLMLTLPDQTDLTMVLPYKYWVNPLQDKWFQG